jgi:predicted dehydrogenase
MTQEYKIAFAGAGSIARAHAYALDALPYYYPGAPVIVRAIVASATPESRNLFASRFGFAEAMAPEDLWQRSDIDTIFILGPNELHYQHLIKAVEMKNIRRIYLEKPICVSAEEEEKIARLITALPADLIIQTGFQYLQMAAVRRALILWREIDFGDPIHFHARYLHDSYLARNYRDERRARLKPAPEGGAVADLGSHAISLLVALLGDGLDIADARQSGIFDDVPKESELCAVLLLSDSKSGAAGTVVASRISAGSGELLEFELRCTGGALRVSTNRPDILEFHKRDGDEEWRALNCGNDYMPVTRFPSASASAGWLRSLIHAHYLLFGGSDDRAVIPNLNHGLIVQQLIRRTAERLAAARRA